MPQFGQYRVYLLDWTGEKLTTLFPGDDFLEMTWQHVRNAPGIYRANFVGLTGTKDLFQKHYQILIERNWGNNPADWYEEFTGFHLAIAENWVHQRDLDEHYWASVGRSPEWLISQPLLQPQANVGNSNWEYYDLWWNHGYADDIAKSMVGESMIDPADGDRAFTNVTSEGYTAQGTYGCYQGRWIRLNEAILNVIGEDGTKGDCELRVERVTGGYEFKTYSPYFGTDRRKGNSAGNTPTIFSFDNGNMRNPQRTISWAEAVTAAYGGWKGGSGMEQRIYYQENVAALAETPYSRREAYYDMRDLDAPDEAPAILTQKLIDDGEVTYVTAEILQTDMCLYGRDFWYGDLVTLILPDGSEYDMRVVQVDGRISGEDVEEAIEGRIELWTRAEAT